MEQLAANSVDTGVDATRENLRFLQMEQPAASSVDTGVDAKRENLRFLQMEQLAASSVDTGADATNQVQEESIKKGHFEERESHKITTALIP